MCVKKDQLENALKVNKKHSNWLDTLKTDSEKRFFDLFDKNWNIQEAFEKVKNEKYF